MALLWGDGFGHWGSAANALSGGYTNFPKPIINNAALARTGDYYVDMDTNGNPICRRVLDDPGSGLFGMGFAWYFVVGAVGCDMIMETGAGTIRVNFSTSDLAVRIYQNAELLGTSATNVFLLNTYCQFEVKINNSGALGSHTVEVRQNGVPINILTVTGLSIDPVTAFYVRGAGSGLRGADLYAWDGTGTANTNWLGDRRCVTLLPNADGALQDWTPSAGAAYEAINNVPPGATYIESSLTGEISDFEKEAVPALTTSIAGIMIFAATYKTDAGPAGYRLGINKGGIVENGSEIFPGTALSFGHSILQLDPDGLAWTRTALDNATVRITRTT